MIGMGVAAAVVSAAVVLIPLMSSTNQSGQVLGTQMQLLAIGEASDDYKERFGHYPETLIALTLPLHDDDGNRIGDPLLNPQPEDRDDNGRFVDRWGTLLRVDRPADGQTMTLHSAGPDLSFGNDDDIVLPLPRKSKVEKEKEKEKETGNR